MHFDFGAEMFERGRSPPRTQRNPHVSQNTSMMLPVVSSGFQQTHRVVLSVLGGAAGLSTEELDHFGLQSNLFVNTRTVHVAVGETVILMAPPVYLY